MSTFGMGLGLPLIAGTYVRDWWSPIYMFPSSYFKIEDIIFGFIVTGVISSVYSCFKNKSKTKIESDSHSLIFKIGVVVLVFSFYLALIHILNIHSFWASIIGSSLVAIIAYAKKITYIKYAFYTGMSVVLVFAPMYMIGLYLNPDFVNNEWLLSNLSGVMVGGVPIEEFVWFLSVGIGLCAFQEIFE
jgi:hypothetical protein